MEFKTAPAGIFCLVLFFFLCINGGQARRTFFNVLKYGAIADGRTDNSKAFLQAWDKACKWKGRSGVLIPRGTYMLKKVTFSGPCYNRIAFAVKGELKAFTDESELFGDSWINFRYVDQLTLSGGGTLDGQGAAAWPRNDCSKNPACSPLPTSLRLDFVTNSRVHHLKSIDSKNNHMVLFGCSSVNISTLLISAPDNSPNTDGIKIGGSNNIRISKTTIGTGDDCISMVSGSRQIDISEVVCGPGHGISIGSLGRYGEEDVWGIRVRNCSIHDTTDGLRIKSWASSFPVKAYDLTYEDILMTNVGNPIQIDQQYCPGPPCYGQAHSEVKISKVKYKTIRGTSASEIAVSFRCSSSKPCEDIVLENISLSGHRGRGQVSSFCVNAYVKSYGQQNPPACAYQPPAGVH